MRRKINLDPIKNKFFASYISVYKNWGMRNLYASYATLKIMFHYSWQQISAQKTFDETDILLIKFSYRKAFCDM